MQLDFANVIELPRTKPTLSLEGCAEFFDKDYLALMVDVKNGVIKFSWDISSVDAKRSEVRIYAASAWAFCYHRPMPKMTEDMVYKQILPNRDIKSTELERILACSHQHVHAIKSHFEITEEPRQEDGPHSFTKFSRASIEKFLRSRRLS